MDDYAKAELRNHPPVINPPTRHHSCSGFTLAELMTTVTIASVLAFGAGPSLGTLLASNRISTSVNEFIAHIYLTRSEAIKRGHDVIMCPSEDGVTCVKTSQWENGWIVFPDENHNKLPDPGELTLRSHSRVKGVDIRSGKYRYRVKYSPLGNSYASNTTFTFCDLHGDTPAKAVILSPSGRPRSSDLDPYNKPLKCGQAY